MRKLTSIFLLLFSALLVNSQVSGPGSYRFLDLPMPARAAGLGGTTMSIWGDDINLYYSNPALLNASATKQLALNYSNFVADLNYGNVAYGYHFKDVGTAAAAIQFFNYGKFERRDEFDIDNGNFKAGDYSINLSFARTLKDTSLSFGATLKTILSQYDGYKAFGNAVDLGANWHHKSGFTASFLVKNAGFIWKHYSETDSSKLPTTSQLGISYKVKKAPFRLIFVYDNLFKWDLTYSSPLDESQSQDPFNTNEQPEEKTKWQKFVDDVNEFGDKFGRHMIIATEVVITKTLNLRVGYNYRQHKEMMLPDKRTASGLTLGFGFGVNRFRFDYAFAKYNVAGNSHVFSITTNLGSYVKKQKTQAPESTESAK